MCFLHFLKKKESKIFSLTKKEKKIYIRPVFNKLENELFDDIFVIDKYLIDIELPCQCTKIHNNVYIVENYYS